jgi:hypothetical protein
MDAASLARAIVVRHKEAGHLRLDLPEALSGPAARAHIEAALRARAGVYRVSFELGGRRLAIRFDPGQCGLAAVGGALRAALDGLPAEPAQPAPAPAEAAAAEADAPVTTPAGAATGLFRRAAYWADRFVGGTIRSRIQPALNGALTEKASINFLNDVLMFYLIKVHWELITKRWMKDPVRHADAWATAFYLIFLLMRYRKSVK